MNSHDISAVSALGDHLPHCRRSMLGTFHSQRPDGGDDAVVHVEGVLVIIVVLVVVALIVIAVTIVAVFVPVLAVGVAVRVIVHVHSETYPC